MTTRRFSCYLRRFVADAFAGLGLFLLGSVLTLSNASFAASGFIGEFGEAAEKLADAGMTRPEIMTLAVAFSLLFALNAAFFRHLRRLYAPARKRRRAS